MARRHLTLRTTDSWEYGLDSSGADEQPLAPAKKRRTFAVVATIVCFAAASMTALAANSASLAPEDVAATSSTADTSSSSAGQTPTQAPTAPPATQASNAVPGAASPATSTPSATPSTPDPSAGSPAAPAASTAPATPAAAVADSSAALSTTDNTSSTTPSAPDASSSTDAIRPIKAVPAPATLLRSPARPHRAIRKPAPIHHRSTTAYALPALSFSLPVFDVKAWESDHPAAPEGEAAVAIAEHYLGVPYVWGGADPLNGFDCSGLTKFVYAQLGVQLPHYAASQWNSGHRVDPGHLQAGDLVFFEPNFDGPGHVGIYIGNDQFIAAPHTGDVVRIGSLSSVANAIGFVGAVRPYDDPAKIAPTRATKTTNRKLARHEWDSNWFQIKLLLGDYTP
jgi:cell wall-associated NlpC family hydrolase